ncbi:serine/threonine protein phosphatase 2B catalytic subunit, putative [Entamoeba invadens IP1]|uniref:Serine/threonine-protein phosphatase n=1 Tax=Entamoeba invadens IP1 TaxID=370355 RepID=A0A0A1TYQ4_ENTIV|nr:serine/threonine protein phosphatase 2B catalytic subunit, putative [Entamoeba invadens IP1]ELP86656.1 serine/threonine protein phosphatase 2B catalytic subunit, putative [Entamoeba invadens IP1]|eukprot:XP_004186002.1 serine/threonine protein phosphatase 2B catalytic subunit, putative [Entamoeba invadens IP1]
MVRIKQQMLSNEKIYLSISSFRDFQQFQNMISTDLPLDSSNKYDLSALEQVFLQGGLITESSLLKLIEEASTYLRLEKNVVEITTDALVFGDFHGQYLDLLTQVDDDYWKTDRPEHTLVFLGDYVDRGQMSCEVLITLLCMKVNDPKRVVLLRGNHESRTMTQAMGFMTECKTKYSLTLYFTFCDLFDTFPLAALVTRKIGKFFLCHGGISPKMAKIEDINNIFRFQEPPNEGLFCDILWADPVTDKFLDEKPKFKQHFDKITFLENKERNCSYLFGYQAIDEFLASNNCIALIRGHQCAPEGVEMQFFGNDDLEFPLCFTVFGATKYSLNNEGGVMLLGNEDIDISKYPTSNEDLIFQPVLGNILWYSTGKLMEFLEDGLKRLIYSAFTTVQEDIDTPFNTPSKREDKQKGTPKVSKLAEMTFEEPSLGFGNEKKIEKRIREESIPISLDELRKKFLELKKQ